MKNRKYYCNMCCVINNQKYPLYELMNGKYLETIYKKAQKMA